MVGCFAEVHVREAYGRSWRVDWACWRVGHGVVGRHWERAWATVVSWVANWMRQAQKGRDDYGMLVEVGAPCLGLWPHTHCCAVRTRRGTRAYAVRGQVVVVE